MVMPGMPITEAGRRLSTIIRMAIRMGITAVHGDTTVVAMAVTAVVVTGAMAVANGMVIMAIGMVVTATGTVAVIGRVGMAVAGVTTGTEVPSFARMRG